MASMISVPLWLTATHPCSYLDGKSAQSAVVDSRFTMSPRLYAQLIEQGFRRSGDQVYAPYCANCRMCIPSRIPVAEFRPDRRQRRCAKRNAQTQVNIKPAIFDPAHFDLYRHYQASRHDRETEATVITPEDYLQFLGSSWCETWFVEFSIADRLMAIAVVDVLDNALSAVYTFFDPAFADVSPGVYAVLWQIEQAAQRGLDYVYLGFWIKDCRKMRYKIQYQPLQGLIDRQWQTL